MLHNEATNHHWASTSFIFCKCRTSAKLDSEYNSIQFYYVCLPREENLLFIMVNALKYKSKKWYLWQARTQTSLCNIRQIYDFHQLNASRCVIITITVDCFYNNYMLNISMHVDTEKTFEYVVYAVRMKIPCIRRIQ